MAYMNSSYKDITIIDSRELFDNVSAYVDCLIEEATVNGLLEEQNPANEYIREIARLGRLCADYEANHMHFKHVEFKSPLLICIEKELAKRSIKQRQAASLLDVKESTFSQVMTGKRPISMRMAKRLYKVFEIDPRLILEYS